MNRGGEACRSCRWRCEGTGYCLWPVCLRICIDERQRAEQAKEAQHEGQRDDDRATED